MKRCIASPGQKPGFSMLNGMVPMTDKYNLNQGQQDAADAFMNFLFSPDKEFIISGAAGVGKTYLMNYIIDQTLPRYFDMCELMGMKPEYDEVVMTATTHKAADVLGQSVKRPTSTVHSFFNLKVQNDFVNGGTRLTQGKQWKIHQRKIIFVDESSMIDTELWRMLHDGTMNCKLVYVGDRHQLAPVQEDLSPIYKHHAPMVELTQPVRNAGSPDLMHICDQLRQTVETGVFKPIHIVPGVIDLLDDNQMQAEIRQRFSQQTHASRILAYTNKRVIQYNDYIRQIRALPDTYTVGEYLVTSSMVHTKQGQIAVEMELEVTANSGPQKLMIDKEHDVELDVNFLDLQDSFGEVWRKVPVMTDRTHFDALLKYYKGQKNWERFYYLKDNIADLRPRDAATVHKAQGSTYDTVFIDLGNISTCNFANQAARMLYVAFSRARSQVFLFGNLADKYGGLILP
ncbi:hypothetical protein EGJ58_22340 [Brucella anthropi]|nr:hypothetical protein EGJ58_22340 [Brucella anthropi]